MQIDTLGIELTRKCNLKCAHCMRGPAQDMDISENILKSIFNNISHVKTLILSGGEPSLASDKIDFITSLIKSKCMIDQVDIVTNAATPINTFKLFLKSVSNLREQCNNKDDCILSYSNDVFHPTISKSHKELINKLKYARAKTIYKSTWKNMINEGNAEGHGDFSSDIPFIKTVPSKKLIGELYINCEGNILPSGNLSYESQNFAFLIIGNINCDISSKKHVNIMHLTKEFNNRLLKIDESNRNTQFIRKQL